MSGIAIKQRDIEGYIKLKDSENQKLLGNPGTERIIEIK